MAQFVTVDKNSKEYRGYLRGDFSRTQRALPIPMQEASARGAQATFQIVAREDVPRKSFVSKLVALYRPELFGFTLLPVGIICEWVGFHPWKHSLLLLAILFFHGAVFAFNDYFDHMQGVDRMSEKRGSRLIQEGQLRAVDVWRLAWVYWTLAILAGLPIVLENPQVLYFLVAGLILGTLGSTYSRFGVKAFAFNDFTVFLCLGPLLTGSVAFAISGKITLPQLILGAGFGLMAGIYVQTRHLSSALTDYRAGVQTLAVRLGFDRMKAFLVIEAATVFGIYAFLTGLLFGRPEFLKFAGVLALVAVQVFLLLKKVLELRSPVSGAAEALPALICRSQFWITIFLFIFLA